MEAIDKLSNELTILIIAHRLSTLKNCTQIIKLPSGQIFDTVDYKTLGIYK